MPVVIDPTGVQGLIFDLDFIGMLPSDKIKKEIVRILRNRLTPLIRCYFLHRIFQKEMLIGFK